MVLEFLAGEWGTLTKLWRLEEGEGARQGGVQAVPGETSQLIWGGKRWFEVSVS